MPDAFVHCKFKNKQYKIFGNSIISMYFFLSKCFIEANIAQRTIGMLITWAKPVFFFF